MNRFRFLRLLLLVLPLACAHAQDTAEPSFPDLPTPTAPDAPTAATKGGRLITLGDYGVEDAAYLALPSTPPTLGLILVPDAYGFDDFTKAEAVRLAGLGYMSLAVDIYNGRQARAPGEIANMVANLDAAGALKTIEAAIRLFRESPKFQVGHVVVVGWGAGAKYVFQLARSHPGVDGAVMFYGPLETQPAAVGKFAVPLCAVYPAKDPAVNPEDVKTFQRLMKAAGNDAEAWFIDAAAGWADPVSHTWNSGADREAWRVAMPFVVRIGAAPPRPPEKKSIIDKIKHIF